jgi:TRAP transporter TAXI family solute receptor
VERYRYIKDGKFYAHGALFPDDLIRATGEGYAHRDAGPFQLRIVSTVSKTDSGYAVKKDSPIKTPSDLKGKKIIELTWGGGGRTAMNALLAWGKVSQDDVTWVPASSVQATANFLRDGKGDVTLAFPASPSWYEVEASPGGLRWLELDPKAEPDALKRYIAERPGTSFGVITTGCPSSIGVKSMSQLAPYVTSASVDPELVYQVVKWQDKNFDTYKSSHPYCQFMTIANLMYLAETDFVPLHDGTVKYLKELGKWTPAHEARRQQNIELLTKWEKAYQDAIAAAEKEGIPVDPANKAWTDFWKARAKATGYPAFQVFPGL